MARLVVVEGIPGVGKTTTAQSLDRLLRERGQECALFLEGDPQPADLAWQAWLSHDEFAEALRRHPAAAAELRRVAWSSPSGVSVAYTKLDRSQLGPGGDHVVSALEQREPVNGTVAPERFVSVLATRWAELGQGFADRPGFVILEAALLQDTLVELVLFARWDVPRLADALRRILAGVAALDPMVVRLVAQEPGRVVEAAAADRVDDAGHRWWHESALDFTVATPWARERGLGRDEALVAYLTERLRIEDDLRPRLAVQWVDLASPAGTAVGWPGLDDQLASLADALARES